jgi:hypothetical protein
VIIGTLVGDRATVEVQRDEDGTCTVSYFGAFTTKDAAYALEVARYIAQHGPKDVGA